MLNIPARRGFYCVLCAVCIIFHIVAALVGDKNYDTSLAKQYWLKTGFQNDTSRYIQFSTFDVCYVTVGSGSDNDTWLCTSPQYNYPFDPYEAWNIVISDSQMPSCFKDHETLYKSSSRAIFPLFVFTAVLFSLCLIIGVITIGTWHFFRWLFTLTVFTFIFSLVASAVATSVFELAHNCVNSSSSSGLTADMGNPALGVAWTGTVFAFGAVLLSAVNFYTNREAGPYEPGTKRYAFAEATRQLGQRLNPNYHGPNDLEAMPELKDMETQHDDQYANLPLEGNNAPEEKEPVKMPEPAPAPQEVPDHYYYRGQYYDDIDANGRPVNYNNHFRRYASPEPEAPAPKDDEAKQVHVPVTTNYNNGAIGDYDDIGETTRLQPPRMSMPDPYSTDIYEEYYGEQAAAAALARGSRNKRHHSHKGRPYSMPTPSLANEGAYMPAPEAPQFPEPQYDTHQPSNIQAPRGPRAPAGRAPPEAYGRVNMYNYLARTRHYEDYD